MTCFRRAVPVAAAVLALAGAARAQELVFLSCVAQTQSSDPFEEVWALGGSSVFRYERDSGEVIPVCSTLVCEVSDSMIRVRARNNASDGWDISRLTGAYRYIYGGATISEGHCAPIRDPRTQTPLF